MYKEHSEELEKAQFVVKFMETSFILNEEKQEHDDSLFDKTNEKEIARMLDKKYSLSEFQNEVYYFFRANVFGIGRTIATAKEKRCTLIRRIFHEKERWFSKTVIDYQ